MKSVLVTIPAHNEAAMLGASVRELARGLDASGLNYRLSIAEDGSTDGTVEVIRQLQSEFPRLLVSTSPERRGRGLALRELWSGADADIFAFVDADLATGPSAVANVIAAVQGGADVATGSRYVPGAIVHRPALRGIVSRAYNRMVQLTFHESVHDHQCGLKAFSREAMTTIFGMTREDSWAWDTEAIVLATLAGLHVVEVPVEWTEYRGAHTPIGRLLSDVYLHGVSVVRLRANLRERMASRIVRRSVPFTANSPDLVGRQDKGSGYLR